MVGKKQKYVKFYFRFYRYSLLPSSFYAYKIGLVFPGIRALFLGGLENLSEMYTEPIYLLLKWEI